LANFKIYAIQMADFVIFFNTERIFSTHRSYFSILMEFALVQLILIDFAVRLLCNPLLTTPIYSLLLYSRFLFTLCSFTPCSLLSIPLLIVPLLTVPRLLKTTS